MRVRHRRIATMSFLEPMKLLVCADAFYVSSPDHGDKHLRIARAPTTQKLEIEVVPGAQETCNSELS